MALTSLDLNTDLATSADVSAAIPVLRAYLKYAEAIYDKRRYEEAGLSVPTCPLK